MKHFPHSQHVYLAGGIEGIPWEEATGWRNDAKKYLSKYDIDCLDPCRRVAYVDDQARHADARIWKADLQDIAFSSVVLANLSDDIGGRKWGTVAEIAHAHTKNKIIIVVLAKDQWVHPFINQYATEIHTSIDEACDAVKEYFL
jgi:nucleoside 2-deoxyribosyltransferase